MEKKNLESTNRFDEDKAIVIFHDAYHNKYEAYWRVTEYCRMPDDDEQFYEYTTHFYNAYSNGEYESKEEEIKLLDKTEMIIKLVGYYELFHMGDAYCDYHLYAPDKKTQWALNTIDRTIDRIASEQYETVTEPVYSFTHDIYAHGLLVQHLDLMDLEDCALKEEEFYMFASLLMKNYNYWE